jgi:imidazolonepropionase
MSEALQDQLRMSTIIRHIGQLVTVAQQTLPDASGVLQVLDNAALAVHEGRIVWIGPDAAVEPLLQGSLSAQAITVIDAHNAVVTPGLVDSHTHLVFAGDRVGEFHLRRDGKSYGDLLAQGRGIITTVQATREATPETLLELA